MLVYIFILLIELILAFIISGFCFVHTTDFYNKDSLYHSQDYDPLNSSNSDSDSESGFESDTESDHNQTDYNSGSESDHNQTVPDQTVPDQTVPDQTVPDQTVSKIQHLLDDEQTNKKLDELLQES